MTDIDNVQYIDISKHKQSVYSGPHLSSICNLRFYIIIPHILHDLHDLALVTLHFPFGLKVRVKVPTHDLQ